MKNPEHRVEKRSSVEMDQLIAETREKLQEIFREGHYKADIEASRLTADEERAVNPEGDREALAKISEADLLLMETAGRDELEKALSLIDTARAIDNRSSYRQLAQIIVNRLKALDHS